MSDFGNIRPPTQGEYIVLLFFCQILFLGLGLVCYGFYFFKPPENPDQAQLLKEIAFKLCVIGFLFWLGRRIIKRLLS